MQGEGGASKARAGQAPPLLYTGLASGLIVYSKGECGADIDSNVFVQESRKGWPERGCNGAHPLSSFAALMISRDGQRDPSLRSG